MKNIASAVFLLVLSSAAFSQSSDVTGEVHFPVAAPPTVIKMPVPKYPDAARKAGVGGTISVRVTVDSDGKVSVKGDPSGPHPVCQAVSDVNILALRKAAAEAAAKVRLKNSLGEEVDGWIKYSFGRASFWETGPVLVAARVVPEGSRVVQADRAIIAQPGERDTPPPPPPPTTPTPAQITTKAGTSDTASSDRPKAVPGGVLNGKAVTLTKPSYPGAARAIKASGSVSVQVLIAHDGTVFTAEALSGHPLLRSASVNAACSSRFSPTLLSGEPVMVSGVIVYNYVP